MAWVNPWLMVFRHLPRVPLYSVVVNIMKYFTATTGIRTPIATVKIKHANHYTIGLLSYTKNKCFFGIHDHIGLRYLFQLRLSLSPLRSHKFHQNFINTPSDIYYCNQGIEDTRHFFLVCPFYVTQRVNLLTRVNEILQKYKLDHLGNQFKLYLYGHDSINHVDNRVILIATIKHIKETRRFST